MSFRKDKIKPSFKHIFLIGFIVLFVLFDFFIINKYYAYPFWHEFKNDIDSVMAAETLSILNGSSFYCNSHPGTTVFNAYGSIYKILNFINPEKYKKMFHLEDIKSLNEVFAVIDLSTKTSRVISLFYFLVFVGVLYALFYEILSKSWQAFLFTFYVTFSSWVLYFSHVVRTELLSMLFIILIFYLTIKFFKKSEYKIKYTTIYFVTIGFLWGLSIYSKIQIIPVALAYFVWLIFYLLKINNNFLMSSKARWTYFIFVFINVLIMPWWAFNRPDFITPQYLGTMHPLFSVHRVGFGAALESFILLPILMLGFLTIIPIFISLFKGSNSLFNSLRQLLFILNLMITGFIVSIYWIFLPISKSFSMYFKNTNYMVYVTLTNIYYGSSISKREGLVNYVQPIGSHLERILNFDFRWLLPFVLILIILRIIKDEKQKRLNYLFCLSWFILAFLMDALAMLRAPYYMDYYSIFPIVFTSIGLCYWFKFEEDNPKRNIINNVFRMFLILILILNVVNKSIYFLKQPHASVISNQNFARDLRFNHLWAKFFWDKLNIKFDLNSIDL